MPVGELVGVCTPAGEEDGEVLPAIDAGSPAVREGVSEPESAAAVPLGDAPAGAAGGVALGERLAVGEALAGA